MTFFPLPLLIAHRGASHVAPENTLAAFRLAWEQGADGIEGDFRLTADGEIVGIHDRTTGRTCGEQRTVAQATLAELRALDCGRWKGPQWAGERVPTVEEVIALVPAGKQFFLEVKCGPEIVAPLKRVVADWRTAAEQLTVISFDPRVIRAMRAELPEIRANWLTEFRFEESSQCWHPTAEEIALALKELGTSGVGVQNQPAAVQQPFAATLQAEGVELHVWTVDNLNDAQHYAALGFRSLTTNRPGDLRRELQALTSE